MVKNLTPNPRQAIPPVACLLSAKLGDKGPGSAKGGYLTFHRTYGPHIWCRIDRLDSSDRFFTKYEVCTCGGR
jgi:hypothetical protein